MNRRMKRKSIMLAAVIAVIISLLLTGCGAETAGGSTEATAEPTTSPYIDTNAGEPEWTPIEIPIFLKDNKYLYATKDNFLCFAFVGTNDDDIELRFMLNDQTAEMMKEQSPDNHYYISIGEEETHIGDVTLSEDCKIVTLKGQHSFEEMTAIATRIRGLD